MGFTRTRYTIQAMIQPSTAGGPVGLESVVWRGMDRMKQILMDPIGGSFILLTNSSLMGSDFPFPLQVFETATLLPPRGHYKRKQQGILAAGFALQIPQAIFEEPPTTVPVEVGKMFDPLLEQKAWRRRKRIHMALRSTSDAPGRWSAFLNATDYQADTCKILGEVQEHLLIGNDAGATWDLWSTSEVLGYFNQRLSRFIKETGCLRKRYTVSTSAATVELPADVMEVRRVALDGVGLFRTDQQQLDYGRVGWDTERGTPSTYVEEPQASLQVTLVPAPSTSGTVDILYIPKPSAITTTCAKLPIPNFMALYVKWGVLADMLKKEGPANEPQRAQYAEGRFMEGVQLARFLMGGVV